MGKSAEEEKKDYLADLIKAGLVSPESHGFAYSMIPHGLFATPGAESEPVATIDGQIGNGSILHHGPQEGGAALDRPSAGVLADAAHEHGLVISREGDHSKIEQNEKARSTLLVNGYLISLVDYALDRDFNAADSRDDARENESLDAAQQRAKTNAAKTSNGIKVPDQDENARDLDRLLFVHNLELETVVETTYGATVHSEITAHGRTLEIDTQFEARSSNHQAELEEAHEHVGDLRQVSANDIETSNSAARYRSQVHAHLQAQASDQGITR